MGKNNLAVNVMAVFFLLQVLLCHGCLEEHRTALLQIKSSFNHPIGNFLQSWGKDTNCCNWNGVMCGVISTTKEVVGIDLSSTTEGWIMGDNWYLNVSLFLPFQHLNSLSLRGKGIVGWVENEGFERLSKLANLERLDLAFNKFNNSILSSLGGLSSLKMLYLDENRLKGSINIQELNQLRSLTDLDLGDNEIEGLKSFHGGDELLKLSNLEYLGLTRNRFNSSILSSLKGLSSLRTLYLPFNQLKGSINMKELDALINLEKIDLTENQIDEFVFSKDHIRGFGNLSEISLINMTSNGVSIPFSLLQSLAKFPNLRILDIGLNSFEGTTLAQALPSLKNLEELGMSHSTLDTSFLQTIGRITTLKRLYLQHCKFEGAIPIVQGLCKLKHLQSVDISDNDLNGTLPWCLANFTSLQQLDVSYNHFSGDISSSPLVSLTSIQELRLSNNHFQIPVSLSPFFNHSELTHLDVSNNEIYAEILEEDINVAPKFQLESLDLSSTHGCGGSFPKFLFHQNSLLIIDFSNLKLEGGFPNWLLDNNTNLYQLHLTNNSLSGPFHLPTRPRLHLSALDISDNYLNSHIPTEIGEYFPSLGSLLMSGNGFISMPSSFGIMLNLNVLDLSRNNISGSLPSHFSSLPELAYVYLSHNALQGSLDAFQNRFELRTLDLSHNRLTGSIPEWIGEIYKLNFLILGHNNLQGRIPIQLCKLEMLSFIDLSHNNFSGHILPCQRLTSTQFLFRGEIIYQAIGRGAAILPLEITTKSISYSYSPSILRYMSGMDLSCNNLTGEIPPAIGNFNYIQVLNLSNNGLIGPIPKTFSNLSEVESLDLSNNNLNGEIPPQLIQLYSLAFFSVAHNNLSGKTPEMVSQFSTFNSTSYADNPFLCGPPLLKSCTTGEEATPSLSRTSSDDDREEGSFIDSNVFYASFIVTYFMVLLGIATVLYINQDWRRAWFYFIGNCINNCYYFLVDNLPMPSRFRGWKPLV